MDTPPELRLQCIEAGIDRVDALLYTHAHADHVNGLDDMRSLNHMMDRPIDTFADASVLDRIRSRFDYAFQPPNPERGWWRPCLNPIAMDGPFVVGDLTVTPIEQEHGGKPSWGFRVGDFAYSPDVNGLNAAAMEALAGLDVWIVDCLRYRPHPSHAHLEQTLEWIARVKPARAVLTNLHVDMDYRTLADALPAGVEPAYDGMVIEV